MIATLAPTVARPNLAVEAKARNNCRYRLGRLRCLHDGKVRTIVGTTWRKEPGLWIYLKATPEPVHASEVVLLDRWPPTCCRSTLRTDGLPRGSGPMKRARVAIEVEDPPYVPTEIEAAQDSGRPFECNIGTGRVTFLDRRPHPAEPTSGMGIESASTKTVAKHGDPPRDAQLRAGMIDSRDVKKAGDPRPGIAS